jgi:hypothetical protein
MCVETGIKHVMHEKTERKTCYAYGDRDIQTYCICSEGTFRTYVYYFTLERKEKHVVPSVEKGNHGLCRKKGIMKTIKGLRWTSCHCVIDTMHAYNTVSR